MIFRRVRSVATLGLAVFLGTAAFHAQSAPAVTPDTRFRVGSISKLFTALAVAQLWEAGRVVYHHGGASTGGRAMLVVWRDLPIAVAITTNLSNAAITERDAMALGQLVMTPAERTRR